MASNDFVPFGVGAGANVLTPALYRSLSARLPGFTSGILPSVNLNTVLRQSSVMSAMVGQFIADVANLDASDNGDLDALQNNFEAAINKLVLDAVRDAAPAPSALWHFGIAGGNAVNIAVPTVTPPISGYTRGLTCLVEMPAGFGTATNALLSIGGYPFVALLRNDGSPIRSGDGPAGAPMLVEYDGTSFRLVGFGRTEVPVIPTTSPVLYVDPAGSDANDGSLDKPFQTIAGALMYGTSRFSLSAGALRIKLKTPGTYAAPGTLPATVGTLIIEGDAAAQDSYIIAGSGPASGSVGVITGLSGFINLVGVRLRNTSTINHTLHAGGPVQITVDHVTFVSDISSQYSHLSSGGGGFIGILDGCVGASSMGSLFTVSYNASMLMVGNFTLANSPDWSDAAVIATGPAVFAVVAGRSFAGTGATGRRYRSQYGGALIQTSGGGTNFFPGSSDGVLLNGGQYA